jgi:hypothetical protein
MNISPFFRNLRSAYFAEIDDLSFDSEGLQVLGQRLAHRRKEIDFLVHMLELSPEMVAVVFHKGFRFRLPAVMDHLLSHEANEFPDWDSLADAIECAPWTQELVQAVLKQPMGEWFLTVAAGLEYMYAKPEAVAAAGPPDEDDEREAGADKEGRDGAGELDGDEEREARDRDEMGADWMAAQGFDRKD